MSTLTQSKIELDEQICFSKGESLFVGRIIKMSEKAVQVDYSFSSVWCNGVPVFTYSTWIPKSIIINDERGSLTVKKWFVSAGLKSENVRTIKKYFISKGEKIYV